MGHERDRSLVLKLKMSRTIPLPSLCAFMEDNFTHTHSHQWYTTCLSLYTEIFSFLSATHDQRDQNEVCKTTGDIYGM